MTQNNGLTYRFDPTGRLLSFGYERDERVISIDYPYSDHNTPSTLPDNTVLISDDSNQRQLELIYNDDGHIIESRLRDMQGIRVDSESCLVIDNCFSTHYEYDNNRHLVHVVYSDGQRADYAYENSQLIEHNDPRAPISPHMIYNYDDNSAIGCDIGCVNTVELVTENAVIQWQALSTEIVLDRAQVTELRAVTVTDYLQNARTYQYIYDSDLAVPREAGTIFTLLSVTSPFDGDINDFDSRPFSYEWEDGLLRAEPARLTRNNDGRNTVLYGYTQDSNINTIDIGYPTFRATYDDNGLTGIAYPDATNALYSYYPDNDETTITNPVTGRLQTFIDRNGAIYAYDYQDNVIIVRRENDNTITRYHFNSIGLIEQVDNYPVGDESNTYTIHYTYDGLGRLTVVNDSIDEFVTPPDSETEQVDYQIDYLPVETDGDITTSMIRVTDITGSITDSRFDANVGV